MSKKYPECPLYNHDNCKDLHNQKLCAIVRKDKKCLKKNPKGSVKNNLAFLHSKGICFAAHPGFTISLTDLHSQKLSK